MEQLPVGSQRKPGSFWLIAATLGVVMFASAAPSPLYPVYQQLWGFSSAMLTVVFAVYVGACSSACSRSVRCRTMWDAVR